MAVQIYNPRKPLNKVIQKWAQGTYKQLQENFQTQKIFPYEVFPGWKQINEQRRLRGQTYSTGEGYKSLEAHGRGSSPGDAEIIVRFNDYLRFVDLGVAGGRPYENVEHEAKANYQRRYIQFWDGETGQTHRPAIMMECRHMQHRMQIYLEDYYGWEGSVEIAHTFQNLDKITVI